MKLRPLPTAVALAVALAGCGNDIGLAKQSVCDGVLQEGEGEPDAPFDVDGDGFFDAANPGCAETYSPQFLDCDDSDPAIPAESEIACNGVDDDCDAETPDGDDVDLDGFDACEDCADAVFEVNPGHGEVACNHLDDDCDPATLDGVDADGDGVTECADCDDANAAVGPLAAEIACNGVDDDCDAATPDGDDLDADGWSTCDDCDDTHAEAHPGATELCDNGLDDDCNGDVDDGCAPASYTDTWTLDDTVSYQCIWGLINIDFDKVLIDDAYPDVTVHALGSGAQPGEMTGTFSSPTAFSADLNVPGTCREVYTFEATFSSDTAFTGTFTAEFLGSPSACYDCTSQSWTVSGSR